MIPFDSLSFEEQTCKMVICCMSVISVLTGSTWELKALALIDTKENLNDITTVIA